MEILDRIHLVTLGGAGEAGAGPTVAAYIVLGKDRCALIDAGFPDQPRTQPLLDYWRDVLGSPATGWILVSHRHYEHAGGVKLLKEATGAKVAAGAGDVAAINADFGSGSAVVVQSLQGGEVFDLGGRRIRAVGTPGHTAGTFCYFLEEEGVLFTGDHIMGRGTVVVRTDEGGTMTEHIDSLRRLLNEDVKIILSGHGPAILDSRSKILQVVQHRQEREEQFIGLLREGVNDVEGLLERIYGPAGERMSFLARHQVLAHLQKLQMDGRVESLGDGGPYRLIPV